MISAGLSNPALPTRLHNICCRKWGIYQRCSRNKRALAVGHTLWPFPSLHRKDRILVRGKVGRLLVTDNKRIVKRGENRTLTRGFNKPTSYLFLFFVLSFVCPTLLLPHSSFQHFHSSFLSCAPKYHQDDCPCIITPILLSFINTTTTYRRRYKLDTTLPAGTIR